MPITLTSIPPRHRGDSISCSSCNAMTYGPTPIPVGTFRHLEVSRHENDPAQRLTLCGHCRRKLAVILLRDIAADMVGEEGVKTFANDRDFLLDRGHFGEYAARLLDVAERLSK